MRTGRASRDGVLVLAYSEGVACARSLGGLMGLSRWRKTADCVCHEVAQGGPFGVPRTCVTVWVRRLQSDGSWIPTVARPDRTRGSRAWDPVSACLWTSALGSVTSVVTAFNHSTKALPGLWRNRDDGRASAMSPGGEPSAHSQMLGIAANLLVRLTTIIGLSARSDGMVCGQDGMIHESASRGSLVR
jgi:hypothetical protein